MTLDYKLHFNINQVCYNREMNTMLEPPVKKELLSNIRKRLVSSLDVVKIVLFGSYASGKPTLDSDLDLLVIINTKEKGIKRYAMVSQILEPRKIPMDIIVRTPEEIRKRLKSSCSFTQNILNTGKVLYEKAS